MASRRTNSTAHGMARKDAATQPHGSACSASNSRRLTNRGGATECIFMPNLTCTLLDPGSIHLVSRILSVDQNTSDLPVGEERPGGLDIDIELGLV